MVGTPKARLNSLTFWYPMLAELQYHTHNPITERVVRDDSGERLLKVVPVEDDGLRIRVPDTIVVHYPYSREIGHAADADEVRGWDELCQGIDTAAQRLGGYPVFIRTESSSDKHSWKNSCYLTSSSDIGRHVYALVEHSLIADLPCDFFAVRRLIPTVPICTAFYGDMPVAKECRVFTRDGEVACHHPYWPDEAFEHDGKRRDGVTDEQIRQLQELSAEETAEVERQAAYIAKYIDGAWSVDFLQDSDGKWWCIDMALASSSYHWPGCEKNVEERRL